MNTTEGNKLIAEFMGAKTNKTAVHEEVRKTLQNTDFWIPLIGIVKQDNLKYHSSWDWLMPVVEKIEKLPVNWKISQFKADGWTKNGKNDHWYEVRIQGNSCDIYESMAMVDIREISLPHNDPYFKFTDKIYAVWLAVVEFINWYNQNK
jgi:hypothetical protein